MQALETMDQHRIAGRWLVEPETVAVINALSAQGATPRFVGGCVRDSLLARIVKDIDIAIDVEPYQTVALIEDAGFRVIPTGLAHGTVTALVGDKSFEITSLREDAATDGRHARVVYTKDWRKDAKRRDFTMNALYAEPDGTVIDFLGTSFADATAHRVRFVGDPAKRIQEDYLRILRLFRFHAWYGRGEMEPDALVAAAGLAGGLAALSRERVGQEVLKLLSAPKPAEALNSMAMTGVLKHALPPANDDLRISQLVELEGRFGLSPSALRRLACLIWRQDPQLAVRALRLSNEQAKSLRARVPVDYELDDAVAARRLGYERGEGAARDVLIISAVMKGRAPEIKYMRAIAEGAMSQLPLKAHDILGLDVQPGPQIGEAIALGEKLWIESDFTLDKSSLLSEIERLMLD